MILVASFIAFGCFFVWAWACKRSNQNERRAPGKKTSSQSNYCPMSVENCLKGNKWVFYHVALDNWLAGPWGVPILGHVPFLGRRPHATLLKWSQKHGPVLSVNFGSLSAVVINDGQLIRKAFSSPKLAGRPFIKDFVDIGGRKGIALTDGPHQQEQRQFLMKHLKVFTGQGHSMEAKVLIEVQSLITRIDLDCGRPIVVSKFYYQHILNSFLDILFNKKFEPDHPMAAEFAHLIDSLLKLDGILENLGLFIPTLAKWFPVLVGYTKRMEKANQIKQFIQGLIQEHEKTLIDGQPRDFTDAYLELSRSTNDTSSSFHPDSGNLVVSLVELFVAGSETSSVTIEWITYFIVKHPEVQQKLHKEIDLLIGDQRIPGLMDRPSLVYTEAFIHEVLRASSVAPFGIFHRATECETLNGNLIPKETMIVSNIYGAHHDAKVWKEPDSFRPERFIDEDGKLISTEKVLAFSCGKRSCIGESLARSQLFLYTTSILQRYEVQLVGKLPRVQDSVFGLTMCPAHFKVVFIRRS